MSEPESHGKASFTLLLALVTVVTTAAAFTSLSETRRPLGELTQSETYVGLTPEEGARVGALLRLKPAAFAAALERIDSPRTGLLLTHTLVELPGLDDPRTRSLAEHLSRRSSSPERARLQRAYLESLAGEPSKRAEAKTKLLGWTLARSLPTRRPEAAR